MTFFKAIYAQYALATLVFAVLFSVAFLRKIGRGEPRKVLAWLVAPNMLRFGGVAGALIALPSSPSPAFLVQVAIADFATAALAVSAFVLLLRKSARAVSTATIMNWIGLSGIVVSQAWLEHLERSRTIVRTTFVHGPTLGAALFSALHLFIFYACVRARTPAADKLDRSRYQTSPGSGLFD